ncbi:hypothetical protein Y032_0270g861 [Ancylostoma ceylanicum]|uniref:Uncharacterized protein n=1 Tax=Ancylostoma ceylanicum TaxID=53326 RepID=A0A016S8L2_9BILA|nr:hypothetical protein Y032_0270g861 [Ancylostoma ceylanicum]
MIRLRRRSKWGEPGPRAAIREVCKEVNSEESYDLAHQAPLHLVLESRCRFKHKTQKPHTAKHQLTKCSTGSA